MSIYTVLAAAREGRKLGHYQCPPRVDAAEWAKLRERVCAAERPSSEPTGEYVSIRLTTEDTHRQVAHALGRRYRARWVYTACVSGLQEIVLVAYVPHIPHRPIASSIAMYMAGQASAVATQCQMYDHAAAYLHHETRPYTWPERIMCTTTVHLPAVWFLCVLYFALAQWCPIRAVLVVASIVAMYLPDTSRKSEARVYHGFDCEVPFTARVAPWQTYSLAFQTIIWRTYEVGISAVRAATRHAIHNLRDLRRGGMSRRQLKSATAWQQANWLRRMDATNYIHDACGELYRFNNCDYELVTSSDILEQVPAVALFLYKIDLNACG